MKDDLSPPSPAEIATLWRCIYENRPSDTSNYYPQKVFYLLSKDGIGPHESQHLSDEELRSYRGLGEMTLRVVRRLAGPRFPQAPSATSVPSERAWIGEIVSAIREAGSTIAAAIERVQVHP